MSFICSALSMLTIPWAACPRLGPSAISMLISLGVRAVLSLYLTTNIGLLSRVNTVIVSAVIVTRRPATRSSGIRWPFRSPAVIVHVPPSLGSPAADGGDVRCRAAESPEGMLIWFWFWVWTWLLFGF